MTLPDTNILLPALLVIVLGLIACFLGFRLFKSAISLYGFIIGAGAGLSLANRFFPDNVLALVIAALVLGLIGALLVRFLYWLGIFIVGAFAGAMLAGAVLQSMGRESLLVVIAAAIIAGILALVLQRLAIILITAFSGGWAVISGVVSLLTGRAITLTGAFTPPGPGQWASLPIVALVAWLVLGLIGALYQFGTTDESGARRARIRRRAL